MARKRAKRKMYGMESGLNLTPLLDIIFNLIFFFVLATNIRDRERYLDITLPASTSGEERTIEKRVPEIAISREGKMYLNGKEMSTDLLERELKRAVETENVSEALITSDAEIPFQQIIDATDICRSAGILQVTPKLRTRQNSGQ